MTKPVRSITIEFERMPGIPRRVVLAFYYRDYYNTPHGLRDIMIAFLNHRREPEHKATRHPSDTFSWEIGMRLCVKRIGNPVLYRAFRRWMWLAKAAHECKKLGQSCAGCPYYYNPRPPCTWGGDDILLPDYHILREFGRVTVRVT